MEEKPNDTSDKRNGKLGSIARVQNSVWKRLSLIKAQHGNSLKLASTIIPLILLCLLAGMTLAQTLQWSIKSSGTLKYVGVSVYWDSACTNQVTAITWGTLTPGASVDNIVYVKNVGTATGTLSMSYGNFTPAAAASYLTFAWNCSSYVLSPDAVACAKLTLSVQPNITGVTDFGFGIIVQASA